jgi:two-component system OmpR family response regulator
MLFNKTHRVLYVDDDEASPTLLVEFFKGWSIETETVENVVQALNLIEQEYFDLYLIDAGLPNIDGLDLCRALREIEPETPIVVYTGFDSESYREKALKAGATAYVVKPDVDLRIAQVAQLPPLSSV